MKICIINNLYPPYARGGAEQVVKRTVDGLMKRGCEVVLITSTPDDDIIENNEKLKIYRIKPMNLFFYTDAYKYIFFVRFIWHLIDIFHIGIAREVKTILDIEKPDVVHTHNLMGLSFLIPRVIRKLHVRHIHTVHDVQLVEPSGIILKTKENSWRYTGFVIRTHVWIMKKLMGSPDVVISPSQFLLDFYTRRGFFACSEKTLLRNPLTFEFGLPRDEGRGAGDDDVVNLLYLGQVETHKGVYLLVDALKQLSEDIRKKLKLHVVGSGSQLEELKKHSENISEIIFHGKKNREELPGLFESTDVTIVPSLCYENSPTVIFESLYFGVPVLASHIEGIAELIDEGKNGYTFTAGDIDSLADKISWVVKNITDVRNMNVAVPRATRNADEYIERLVDFYLLYSKI